MRTSLRRLLRSPATSLGARRTVPSEAAARIAAVPSAPPPELPRAGAASDVFDAMASAAASAVSSTAAPAPPFASEAAALAPALTCPEHALAALAQAAAASEPPACAAYRFGDPTELAPALAALSHDRRLTADEKLDQVLRMLRGARQGPLPAQRQLAAEMAANFLTEGTVDLDSRLRSAAAEASDAELASVDSLQALVARGAPLPLAGMLSLLAGRSAASLGKLRPADFLAAPEQKPVGMPHSAHAFMRALLHRRGPFYRGVGYVRVHKEEREHLPWVVNRILEVAPTFFRQYCRHEEKRGVHRRRLVEQCDLFLVFISEKLFSMCQVMVLQSLLRRQLALDSAGCIASRHRFEREYRWAPPPLAAVSRAFGVDVAERQCGQNFERPILTWQRRHLWNRRRVPHVPEKLLPSLEQLSDMALAAPLRHRPFAAMLSELYGHEEILLRPWYSRGLQDESVLHVLWSAELVQHMALYLASALGHRHGSSTILCLGSGASSLSYSLEYLLTALLPQQRVRVIPAVPAVAAVAETEVSSLSDLHAEGAALPTPAEGRLDLDNLLEVYEPNLVVCAAMPPKTDWSRALRRCSTVEEYLLVGPADSDRCGDLRLTWGMVEQSTFERCDMEHELGRYCLGTEDAPGAVGANTVVSFRRRSLRHLRCAQPRLPAAEPPNTSSAALSRGRARRRRSR